MLLPSCTLYSLYFVLVLNREAEMATDVMRALLLEMADYDVQARNLATRLDNDCFRLLIPPALHKVSLSWARRLCFEWWNLSDL